HTLDDVLDRAVLADRRVDHAGDTLDGVVDGAVLLGDLLHRVRHLVERAVDRAALADDGADGARGEPPNAARRVLDRRVGGRRRGRGAREDQTAGDERGRERPAHELPLHVSPCNWYLCVVARSPSRCPITLADMPGEFKDIGYVSPMIVPGSGAAPQIHPL